MALGGGGASPPHAPNTRVRYPLLTSPPLHALSTPRRRAEAMKLVSSINTQHFQGPHSNCIFISLCFPSFFPVRPQISRAYLHYCDYYIQKTDSVHIPSFQRKLETFANILYLLNQGVYNLNEKNSLCFP